MIARIALSFSLALFLLPMGCADSTGSGSEESAGESSEDTGPGAIGDNEWILSANCGDDTCDSKSENAINCPDDCGSSAAATCIEESCSLSLNACLSTNECTAVVTCLLACESSDCGDACLEGTDETTAFIAGDVLTCAQESCGESLYQPATEEGDEEGGASEGGASEGGASEGGTDEDGEEDGEIFPEGGTGGDIDTDEIFECIEEQCPDEVAACFADPACTAILDCIEACPPNDSGCLQGCALSGGFNGPAIALIQCGSGTDCLEGFGGGPGGGGPGGGGPGGGGEDDGDEDEDEGEDEGGEEDEGGDWNTCGNGVCDDFEEFWCPEDCDDEEDGEEEEDEDEGGDWNTCGNGECDDFEEWWCPQDCEEEDEDGKEDDDEDGKEDDDEDGKEDWEEDGKEDDDEDGKEDWEEDGDEDGKEDGEEEGLPEPMQEKLECIANNCVLGMCLSNEACGQSLICMSTCNTSECAEACADSGPSGGPAANILSNAVGCAEENGCLEYESDDPEDCVFVSCGDELAYCFLDPGCMEQMDCSGECDKKPPQFQEACQEECYEDGMNSTMQELYFCTMSNSCGG